MILSGVLVFDLDKFKALNDSFGHACGDRALQEVAKTVVGSLRPADIVGRWGGDEFLAIIRNVNHEILGYADGTLRHDGRSDFGPN